MKNRTGNFIMQVLLLVSLVVDLGFPPALQAQTDPFFKGKTIRIIGGSGGFYESWARIIARHMGKHVPGNPNIIVQPMLGAGSLIAANYVYNVAKPDNPGDVPEYHLPGPAGWAQRGPVCRGKIWLDRLSRRRSHDALYACGYPV
jgi:hypothetical protein